MSVKWRAGFVGAGYISAFHAEALRRIPSAELAAVYDADPQRCAAAAQNLNTSAATSLDELARAGVNVVHVLTPPESHAAIALRALELGAHVLVEKPLATDAADCRLIANVAQSKNLRVCVDHSLLYDPYIRRALNAVKSGAIGRLVSMHILRTAEYPPYKGGPLPPQYCSAGFPFRDLGVHQLYLMNEFLGPIEDAHVEWRHAGGDSNLAFDEWQGIVRCRDGSGQFSISFAARPLQNVLVLQGTRGALRVDQMSMFETRRYATPLPKTIERVFNSYGESLQTLVRVPASAAAYARKQLRQHHGVQELVREFYAALDSGGPVPVSAEEAAPVVEWVERIARGAEACAEERERAKPDIQAHVPIAVTGAAGALGSAVVERMREQKTCVRAFVRPNADVPQGIDVVTGDLGDPRAVDKAIDGAAIVIHAGAATKGSRDAQHTSTVVGTANVIEACLKYGVRQLVYISSLSVTQWAGTGSGTPMTESSPLECRASARGAYTQSKLEAERLVCAAVRERGLPAVILRPGQIYGGRLPVVNDAVARRVGRFHIVLGDGSLRLPLVHMNDVVDAIVQAMRLELRHGEIIQLVGTGLPTQNQVLKWSLNGSGKILRVPRPVVFGIGWASELALACAGRTSPLSRYRLQSALAHRTFRSEAAKPLLNWSPRKSVSEDLAANSASAVHRS